MKEIHSISDTGLVLFDDETKRGATTQGTQEDCLAYGYNFQNGNCFCYNGVKRTEYEKGVSIGNQSFKKTRVLGDANDIKTGDYNMVSGRGHRVRNNASFVTVAGTNGYSENFGEKVYSVSNEKERARVVELHYVGTTTDDTATELFIGGQGNNRFIPNPDFATAYHIEKVCTALNAVTGEIWTKNTIHAVKNIGGTLTEVGSYNIHTIRDSNLDYNCNLVAVDSTDLTPGYIKINVTGETGHTAYWNISLKITEVRQQETLANNSTPNPDFLGTPTWSKINQDANNTITIPNDPIKGGARLEGNGGRNLAVRSSTLTWGTNLWKITFDLQQVKGTDLKCQVRVNNQNSDVFTTIGTHSYYVNTVGGANFIQFMVNQTTGAGACVVNNVRCQIVTY